MTLLFLLQYVFLNGFLLHWFFLKNKKSGTFETIVTSIVLSLSINSVTIYLLSRLLEIGITRSNVMMISFELSVLIALTGVIIKQLRKKGLIRSHE